MKRLLRATIAACGAGTLIACATPAPPAPVPGAAAEEPLPALAEPPADVAEALVPSVAKLGTSEREPGGEVRFDVSVNEAPLREFLGSLVQGTPYDIVVHPDVQGNVSLDLRRVSVPEVLDAVREIAPIDHRRSGRVFFVGPASLRSRTFQIDYLNVQRGGRSETRVSSGQVSEGARSGDEGGVDEPIVTGGEEQSSVIGSRVSTDSQVDFWVELDETLHALVGAGPERLVVVSPHSGLVVVRAAPLELRDVERYLADVQRRIAKTVVLEAKILEVALSDEFQSGINWGVLADAVVAAQTGGGSLIRDGISEIAGGLGNLDPDLGDLPAGTPTSAFGGAFSLAIDTEHFRAFVELLEKQGEVHTLSNPRITTVSNQKAVIKVGSDEFFVTDVSSTTVTGTATTTTPDITLTPFFSGIALDVTPQVGVDDEVTLHVHPSVSLVQDQTKDITIAGETQSLPLAFSTIRESDSVVRARSGQIIVIGGLIEDGARNDRAGVPWFGRIPYAGAVFRHTATGARRRELVILLRPLVVDDEVWDEELVAAEGRLREIDPNAARLLRGDPTGRPRKPAPW